MELRGPGAAFQTRSNQLRRGVISASCAPACARFSDYLGVSGPVLFDFLWVASSTVAVYLPSTGRFPFRIPGIPDVPRQRLLLLAQTSDPRAAPLSSEDSILVDLPVVWPRSILLSCLARLYTELCSFIPAPRVPRASSPCRLPIQPSCVFATITSGRHPSSPPSLCRQSFATPLTLFRAFASTPAAEEYSKINCEIWRNRALPFAPAPLSLLPCDQDFLDSMRSRSYTHSRNLSVSNTCTPLSRFIATARLPLLDSPVLASPAACTSLGQRRAFIGPSLTALALCSPILEL
ncbi:hypothetical protein B0H15DRAFT_957832 [Mycena belliarum]|uniref:Uncharacterized protein n=1 Tax=Mycena belliarum TaxID=1033014 RepID=A0AAD6TRZ7_9AGAR|nr:hypothetical protein B0H15DRAFT_957832 [Mycena belliae]